MESSVHDPVQASTLQTLDALQRQTFSYFVHEVNPANGLIADQTQEGSPASIAAVGLALAAYPVGVERGFISRDVAVERTLATLRFFRHQPSRKGSGGDGLQRILLSLPGHEDRDGVSGNVSCPRSIRTFLLTGMLTAAAYFAE